MGGHLGFQSSRLESLDVFRGIAIVGMLLVISPGSGQYVYGPLRHAEWNGFTFADLVFPLFVFTVGVAVALSLSKRIQRGEKRRTMLLKVIVRTAVLFGLGLVLNRLWYGDSSGLRVTGVLQRIALCYFFTSIIFMVGEFRGLMVSAAVLLLSYWVMMKLVPVPGYGPGVLEKDGNLAAYLDNLLLHGHLYKENWDPEGLLSTMPAVATAVLGASTGVWVLSPRTKTKKALGMILIGCAGASLGMLWNVDFPINKNLWSSSYVVFTAGIMLLIFAFCYWLVDIKGWGMLTKPLTIFGRNALATYLISDVTKYILIRNSTWTQLYRSLSALSHDPTAASLLHAITYTLVWLGPAALLYRKGITIKI